MKRLSGPRKTSNLSDSTHQQLNMYTMAAGAAGVSLLALAQSAEAKIIYTPVHVSIGRFETYKIDFNHDGVTDVTIKGAFISRTHVATAIVSAIPATGNGVEGTLSSNFYAAALSKGAAIGKNEKFGGQAHGAIAAFVRESSFVGFTFHYGGNWVNVKNRYLGVRLKIAGKTHFGWARLNVFASSQGPTVGATITGFAYETIPGKSIKAGQTRSAEDDGILNSDDFSLINPTPTAPQPANLGLLALGAQGVALWRRKESAGATSGAN